MNNIKPISDLRNNNNVLNDGTVGAPVFLTKNERGKYAILDMKDFEKNTSDHSTDEQTRKRKKIR